MIVAVQLFWHSGPGVGPARGKTHPVAARFVQCRIEPCIQIVECGSLAAQGTLFSLAITTT